VAGDATPRIAWKALDANRFAGQTPLPNKAIFVAGLVAVAQYAQERKLELLTRWVLDAEAQGMRYGLRLPGREMQPAQGQTHRAECLRALALYGLAEI
jgi:hypothetical protein